MRLELIRKGINLGHSYSIVYEFNNYNNTIGFRKIGSYGHINQQYWSIEGRKGYEEWWVDILKIYDKSFNI
jgi:hypothetical protein